MGWGTKFYMVDPNIYVSSVSSLEFSENLGATSNNVDAKG